MQVKVMKEIQALRVALQKQYGRFNFKSYFSNIAKYKIQRMLKDIFYTGTY